MEPRVSVIIPVYNAEKYLEACLHSVISQEYKNIEIVIVNDGSKDRSGEICAKIASKNKNIILVNQENAGVSAARNHGIALAKGEYVTFLDSDDLLPEKAVQVLMETAQQSNADMVIGRLTDYEKLPIGVFEGEDFLEKVLEDSPVGYSACRILYKRALIQDVKFPEGYGCGEDSFFVFLCAMKMPKVVTIDQQVYVCISNPESATRSSFTMKRYRDVNYLYEEKEKMIKEKYEKFIPLVYHLKVKIQMMLLANLINAKGKEFREKEKETLRKFNRYKSYFRPDLPSSNGRFYQIIANGLYYPYKIVSKTARNAKYAILRLKNRK